MDLRDDIYEQQQKLRDEIYELASTALSDLNYKGLGIINCCTVGLSHLSHEQRIDLALERVSKVAYIRAAKQFCDKYKGLEGWSYELR